MGQDIISFGLDVTQFSAEKEQTLNRFIGLFDNLSKYDGKVINPVLGQGLVEFNNSVASTSQLLNDLNSKLSTFNTTTGTTASTTSRAAKSTKELTAEQAALKVSTQEANKATIEQARAQNASVQSRQAQKKANEDLIALNKAQYNSETELANQQKADMKVIASLRAKDAADQKKIDADRAKSASDLRKAQSEKDAQDKRNIQTAKEESRVTEKLISDLNQLKLARKDQATNYSNLYINKGANSPATLAALSEYQTTNNTIIDIEKNLNSSSTSARVFSESVNESSASMSNLGRSLTSGLSTIRTLAYILPGIGIAGIFNLAYEAISAAAESLFDFKGGTEAILRREQELNTILSDTRSILKDIAEEYTRIYKINSSKDIIGIDERDLDLQNSFAENNNKILESEIKLGELRLKLSTNNLINQSPDDTKKRIDSKKLEINELERQLFNINTALNKGDFEGFNYVDPQTKQFLQSKELIKSKRESIESQIKFETDKLKELDNAYSSYYDNQRKLENSNTEYKKLLLDQARKTEFENAKSSIDLNKDKQDKILSAEISSYDQRRNALKQLLDDQLKLNAAELKNIVTNNSSNPDEIAIAQFKFNPKNGTENIKAQAEFIESSEKLFEDYRQRLLTANEKISKDSVEKDAIANERIYKNEQNNLEQRLTGYEKYVTKKQVLQDIQFTRDIDVLSLKAKGPVPQKEIDALQSNRDTLKANIQADAEKQIYDIVFQSFQKKLKLIVDYNQKEDDTNLKQYTKDLEDLNKSYEDKIISYRDYKTKRKELDNTYGTLVLDNTIDDNIKDLNRLKEQMDTLVFKAKQSKKELDNAGLNVKFAEDGGTDKNAAKLRYDSAVGQEKAIGDAIIDLQVKIDGKEHEIEQNRNKRAKKNYDDKIALDEDYKKRRGQIINALQQIENAAYQATKTIVDSEYQNRIQKIEAENRVIQEQLGLEIAAIEKSSLSAKDKQALDIQLNAQKLEREKETAREEKKIKHDQAVFDKELTIAHILLSTAAAVAELIEIPPLAIAAGVAGAAELAVAASVRIPSYSEGVQGHPGGFARFGEDGIEVVKEPYKSPYLVYKETIGFLPKGTDVIPVTSDPVFSEKRSDGWDQTRWLAKQIAKNKKEIKNVFSPIINIDLGFENHKRQILCN